MKQCHYIKRHKKSKRRLTDYVCPVLMYEVEAGFYGLHVRIEIIFHNFKAVALLHNHPKSD